jgi:NDP-sugar pyrophosphorylase family protein
MQAIVLAAGEGVRIRPLTSSHPKAMLPIGGRPLLEGLVARAKEAGVERFVIVVGHQKEKEDFEKPKSMVKFIYYHYYI